MVPLAEESTTWGNNLRIRVGHLRLRSQEMYSCDECGIHSCRRSGVSFEKRSIDFGDLRQLRMVQESGVGCRSAMILMNGQQP